MAKAKQGITIKAVNKRAKYKLTYTLSQNIKTTNGQLISKYTFSKLITPITKKYSYN